jgi:hypothetical protein
VVATDGGRIITIVFTTLVGSTRARPIDPTP